MYYNITENLIQFSKNKSESKYAEDDYGLYANRKYSFMLAYGERVMEIKWYGFESSSAEISNEKSKEK